MHCWRSANTGAVFVRITTTSAMRSITCTRYNKHADQERGNLPAFPVCDRPGLGNSVDARTISSGRSRRVSDLQPARLSLLLTSQRSVRYSFAVPKGKTVARTNVRQASATENWEIARLLRTSEGG